MFQALARMLLLNTLRALVARLLARIWLKIRVYAWALLASYRLVRYKAASQNALHLVQEAETCLRMARCADQDMLDALANHDVSVDKMLAEAQEKLGMARELMAFVRPDIHVERD